MNKLCTDADASKRVEEAVYAVQWFTELVAARELGNLIAARLAENQLRRLGWDVRSVTKEQGSNA